MKHEKVNLKGTGFAAALLLLGMAVPGPPGTALAQPSPQAGREAASAFDLVEECDLLAAHPGDLQRVAEGVADDAIIPRLAVRACEAALRGQPDEPRFSYQLGRALIAADRLKDAKPHLDRAAAAGHAAAIAAQADLALRTSGAAGARREDIEAAAALHARAVQSGFPSSAKSVETMRFDPALYTQRILGQIAAGDFTAASAASQQPDIRAYLYAFLTNVMSQCGPVLEAESVVRLALFRFGGKVSAEQEESPVVSLQPLVGEIDAQRFVRRHGCEGPSAGALFLASVSEFLKRD